jgi:hypothetical protein
MRLEGWMVDTVECAVEMARRNAEACACATCVYLRSIGRIKKVPDMGPTLEEPGAKS